MYFPEPGDEPPPQQIFLLELVDIDETHARLSALDGKEVRVALRFQMQDLCILMDPVLDSEQSPYPGVALHVKDLGKLARKEMGLPPSTPLFMSTRVVYEGNVLPMHRPLATLLASDSPFYHMAQRCCHFCRRPLRGNRRGGEPLVTAGPYNQCLFCEDTPAWHHGACCPHNEAAPYCQGMPHASRYRRHWRSHLATLRQG